MCDVLSGITDPRNADNGGSYINISRKFQLFLYKLWSLISTTERFVCSASIRFEIHSTTQFSLLSFSVLRVFRCYTNMLERLRARLLSSLCR
jgi:hypothetical protein